MADARDDKYGEARKWLARWDALKHKAPEPACISHLRNILVPCVHEWSEPKGFVTRRCLRCLVIEEHFASTDCPVGCGLSAIKECDGSCNGTSPSHALQNNALAPGQRKTGEIAGYRNDDAPLERDVQTRPTSQERVSNPVECTTSAPSTTRQTAKQQFAELLVEDAAPLERLRLFCSLAMNGQDWLDVEPFFDALETTASATPRIPGLAFVTNDGVRKVGLVFNTQEDADAFAKNAPQEPR